jgi:cathepsin H
VTTLGSFNITEKDEHSVKQILAFKGPVSVGYHVPSDFKEYREGIYTHEDCPNTTSDVTHAVTAVGYGVEDGMEYFLVKNSWGEQWGNQGYFKIQAGVNMCGIGVCNAFPIGVHTISH